MRPPLIPLLFVVLRSLLAPGVTRGFVALQTVAALVSSVAVVRALARWVGLTYASAWIVGIVLAIPQMRAATTIGSESLAYSFLCLAFAHAIPLLFGHRSRRSFLWMVASCGALVSTRGQFIYIPPLCVLGLIAFVRAESSWSDRLKTLGGAACVPVVVLSLQAAHTYPKVHHFARVAVTGLQTMTMTTFIATDADVAAIPDPAAREFAARIRSDVRNDAHLSEQAGGIALPFFLGDHYNEILNRIYDAYFEGVAGLPHVRPEERDAVPAEIHVRMDQLTLAASAGIARHAWKRLLVFCLTSIMLWDRYMAILAVGMLAVGASHLRKAPGPARLLVLVSALWWVNVCLVAALEPPQSRYTFYFDELVVVLALATGARALALSRSAADEPRVQT